MAGQLVEFPNADLILHRRTSDGHPAILLPLQDEVHHEPTNVDVIRVDLQLLYTCGR